MNKPTTFCDELKNALNIVSLKDKRLKNFEIGGFLKFKIPRDSIFKIELEELHYTEAEIYVPSLPCPLDWAMVYITKNIKFDGYILFAKKFDSNMPKLFAVVKEHLTFLKTGEAVIKYFKNFPSK